MYTFSKLTSEELFMNSLNDMPKNGSEVMLLLLYDETTPFIKDSLENSFVKLNNLTDGAITMLSYFEEPNPDIGYKRAGARENATPEYIEEENGRNPYEIMTNIANMIDMEGTGLANAMPCIILIHPSKKKFKYVWKTVRGVTSSEDILNELKMVIDNLRNNDFDIEGCLDTDTALHNVNDLSIDMLNIMLESINRKAINIEFLKKIMQQAGEQDVLNTAALKKFSEDEWIRLEDFFRHYDKIINSDKMKEESKISLILEKYLNNWKINETEMLYPVVKPYIRKSSVNLLTIANYFKTQMDSGITGSYASMIAFCLGKVYEDEQNMGIMNKYRSALDMKGFDVVDMNKRKREQTTIVFMMENGNTKQINFNESNKPDASALKYPNISNLRSISFGKWTPQTNNANFVNVYNEIKKYMNELDREYKLYDKCVKLSELRNTAVHQPGTLNRVAAENAMNNFEEIVKSGFFIQNFEYKNITN